MDAGWDGDWFLRAYDAMSNPVGSKVCEEGQIFIEPQGMCDGRIGTGYYGRWKSVRCPCAQKCGRTPGYQIRHYPADSCLYNLSCRTWGDLFLPRRDIRKMPESSAIIIHGSAVPRRFSVMAAGLSRSSKRLVLLIWKIRGESAGPSRMSTVR